MSLFLSFEGWCIVRLATDPDPCDEPRGISGYTFAFPGERDLDRIVRFQPPDDPAEREAIVRSQSGDGLGVKITEAVYTETGDRLEVLVGATVNLDGDPKLENRNWTLTLPGCEPIFPFKLRISKDDLKISRDAPLDPEKPNQPVWKASSEALAAQGASGINYEPETIGDATGIWDSLQVVKDRLEALTTERAAEHDPVKQAALDGRIGELQFGIANPTDRRVMVRYYVERFSFPVTGRPGEIDDPHGVLTGVLDEIADWNVSFWMGAWDPDLLSAFVRGSLEIPFRQLAAQGRLTSAGDP